MKTWILFAILLPLTVHACIWDAETLSHEKSRSHDLAEVILGEQQTPSEDSQKLKARITDLETNREETDPDWWNNLAGAYIRSGQSQKAVDLLEPILQKFPDNYGIHANLGTAYHLLGRYADAEKEIARDLEINPEAHFGLEKYHLALLQYLARDTKYQARHLYVDEFTATFLETEYGGHLQPWAVLDDMSKAEAVDYTTNDIARVDAEFTTLARNTNSGYGVGEKLAALAAMDPPPAYRAKWNLANDTNFEAGVIYMAQMNPKEPACLTMLGIAAWRNRNYHLAASAFEKSIALGSPQSTILKTRAAKLRGYIGESLHNNPRGPFGTGPLGQFLFGTVCVLLLYYFYSKLRDSRRRRISTPVAADVRRL